MNSKIIATALSLALPATLPAQHADSTHASPHPTNFHAAASITNNALREGYSISDKAVLALQASYSKGIGRGSLELGARMHRDAEHTPEHFVSLEYRVPFGKNHVALELAQQRLHDHYIREVAAIASRAAGPILTQMRIIKDLQTAKGLFFEAGVEADLPHTRGTHARMAYGTHNRRFPEHGGIGYASLQLSAPIAKHNQYQLRAIASGQAAAGEHGKSGATIGFELSRH